MRVQVRNLWRTHAGAPHAVLRGLSLELESGALVALLGRSGAGKSTLLRCMVGLEPFERGEMEVDGAVLRGTEECTVREREAGLRALRERTGLVFQSFELFPHLTALENCTLAPMKVKGLPRAQAEAQALGLLEQLGLQDKAAFHPARLSGGQRQRVAIARALAMAPRVLLYDEPTSALDPSLKGEVLAALRRVEATGVTQVVVTHDLQVARGAEHVAVLAEGQVVERGHPDDVLQRPGHEATRTLLAAG